MDIVNKEEQERQLYSKFEEALVLLAGNNKIEGVETLKQILSQNLINFPELLTLKCAVLNNLSIFYEEVGETDLTIRTLYLLWRAMPGSFSTMMKIYSLCFQEGYIGVSEFFLDEMKKHPTAFNIQQILLEEELKCAFVSGRTEKVMAISKSLYDSGYKLKEMFEMKEHMSWSQRGNLREAPKYVEGLEKLKKKTHEKMGQNIPKINNSVFRNEPVTRVSFLRISKSEDWRSFLYLLSFVFKTYSAKQNPKESAKLKKPKYKKQWACLRDIGDYSIVRNEFYLKESSDEKIFKVIETAGTTHSFQGHSVSMNPTSSKQTQEKQPKGTASVFQRNLAISNKLKPIIEEKKKKDEDSCNLRSRAKVPVKFVDRSLDDFVDYYFSSFLFMSLKQVHLVLNECFHEIMHAFCTEEGESPEGLFANPVHLPFLAESEPVKPKKDQPLGSVEKKVVLQCQEEESARVLWNAKEEEYFQMMMSEMKKIRFFSFLELVTHSIELFARPRLQVLQEKEWRHLISHNFSEKLFDFSKIGRHFGRTGDLVYGPQILTYYTVFSAKRATFIRVVWNLLKYSKGYIEPLSLLTIMEIVLDEASIQKSELALTQKQLKLFAANCNEEGLLNGAGLGQSQAPSRNTGTRKNFLSKEQLESQEKSIRKSFIYSKSLVERMHSDFFTDAFNFARIGEDKQIDQMAQEAVIHTKLMKEEMLSPISRKSLDQSESLTLNSLEEKLSFSSNRLVSPLTTGKMSAPGKGTEKMSIETFKGENSHMRIRDDYMGDASPKDPRVIEERSRFPFPSHLQGGPSPIQAGLISPIQNDQNAMIEEVKNHCSPFDRSLSQIKEELLKMDWNRVSSWFIGRFNRLRYFLLLVEIAGFQELKAPKLFQGSFKIIEKIFEELHAMANILDSPFEELFIFWSSRRTKLSWRRVSAEIKEKMAKSGLKPESHKLKVVRNPEDLGHALKSATGLSPIELESLAIDAVKVVGATNTKMGLACSNALLGLFFRCVNKKAGILEDENADIRTLVISWNDRLSLRPLFEGLLGVVSKLTPEKIQQKMKKNQEVTSLVNELKTLGCSVLKFVLIALWVMDFWFRDASSFTVETPLKLLILIVDQTTKIAHSSPLKWIDVSSENIVSFALLRFVHTLLHSVSANHLTPEGLLEMREALHKQCFGEDLQIRLVRIIFQYLNNSLPHFQHPTMIDLEKEEENPLTIQDKSLMIEEHKEKGIVASMKSQGQEVEEFEEDVDLLEESGKSELVELFRCFYGIPYAYTNNLSVFDDNPPRYDSTINSINKALLITLFTHVHLQKAPVNEMILSEWISKASRSGCIASQTGLGGSGTGMVMRSWMIVGNVTASAAVKTAITHAFQTCYKFLKNNSSEWCFCNSFERFLTECPSFAQMDSENPLCLANGRNKKKSGPDAAINCTPSQNAKGNQKEEKRNEGPLNEDKESHVAPVQNSILIESPVIPNRESFQAIQSPMNMEMLQNMTQDSSIAIQNGEIPSALAIESPKPLENSSLKDQNCDFGRIESSSMQEEHPIPKPTGTNELTATPNSSEVLKEKQMKFYTNPKPYLIGCPGALEEYSFILSSMASLPTIDFLKDYSSQFFKQSWPLACQCEPTSCFKDSLLKSIEAITLMLFYTGHYFDDANLSSRLTHLSQEKSLKILVTSERIYRHTMLLAFVHYQAQRSYAPLVCESIIKLSTCMIEMFWMYADNIFDRSSWKKLNLYKTHDFGALRLLGVCEKITNSELGVIQLRNEIMETKSVALFIRFIMMKLARKLPKLKQKERDLAKLMCEEIHELTNQPMPDKSMAFGFIEDFQVDDRDAKTKECEEIKEFFLEFLKNSCHLTFRCGFIYLKFMEQCSGKVLISPFAQKDKEQRNYIYISPFEEEKKGEEPTRLNEGAKGNKKGKPKATGIRSEVPEPVIVVDLADESQGFELKDFRGKKTSGIPTIETQFSFGNQHQQPEGSSNETGMEVETKGKTKLTHFEKVLETGQKLKQSLRSCTKKDNETFLNSLSVVPISFILEIDCRMASIRFKLLRFLAKQLRCFLKNRKVFRDPKGSYFTAKKSSLSSSTHFAKENSGLGASDHSKGKPTAQSRKCRLSQGLDLSLDESFNLNSMEEILLILEKAPGFEVAGLFDFSADPRWKEFTKQTFKSENTAEAVEFLSLDYFMAGLTQESRFDSTSSLSDQEAMNKLESPQFHLLIVRMFNATLHAILDLHSDCLRSGKKRKDITSYCESRLCLLRNLGFFFANKRNQQFCSFLSSATVDLLSDKLNEKTQERDYKMFLIQKMKHYDFRMHVLIRKTLDHFLSFLPPQQAAGFAGEAWKRLKKVTLSLKDEKNFNKALVYLNVSFVCRTARYQLGILKESRGVWNDGKRESGSSMNFDKQFFYDLMNQKSLVSYFQSCWRHSGEFIDMFYRLALAIKCQSEGSDVEGPDIGLLRIIQDFSVEIPETEGKTSKEDKMVVRNVKKYKEAIFKHFETACKKVRAKGQVQGGGKTIAMDKPEELNMHKLNEMPLK